jgi:hypothetical protein
MITIGDVVVVVTRRRKSESETFQLGDRMLVLGEKKWFSYDNLYHVEYECVLLEDVDFNDLPYSDIIKYLKESKFDKFYVSSKDIEFVMEYQYKPNMIHEYEIVMGEKHDYTLQKEYEAKCNAQRVEAESRERLTRETNARFPRHRWCIDD